jgi:chromosome segregation ATPase
VENATTVGNGDTQAPPRFKSPRRVLLRFFERSRNRWKEKCKALKKEKKRLENRARDQAKSRDNWREKAERWQTEAAVSKAEIARLEAELAAARAAAGKKGARSFPPR